MAYTTGDDRRVDPRLCREFDDRHGAHAIQGKALPPKIRRYQRVLGPPVGVQLLRTAGAGLHAAQGVVVDEAGLVVAFVQVEAHVGQLVEEGEPEIVYAVVTQRQPDHRPAVWQPEGGPVQMGLGQVPHELEGEAVTGQEVSGAAGTVL